MQRPAPDRTKIGAVTVSDEILFERFRARGDGAALGELFDRAAPGLLRIALHLTRDPAAAEDLVQATFLKAIEARGEWDGRLPLLPWLCGILHNRARTARKRDERAPDPVRLRDRAPLDPARAAEAADFDAAIDATIASMAEVYQPVLRLHLAYGHTPAEIAHALGRPPGTVRSQLARGLELLRRSLPVGLTGVVASSLGAGKGLAAMRTALLAQAAATVPVAPLLGTALGGVMATKVWIGGVAACAAIGVGWFSWPRKENAGAPAVPPAAVDGLPPMTAASSAPKSGAAHVAAEPARSVVVSATAPTTGSLDLVCRWREDGAPAAEVTLDVTVCGERHAALLARSVVTPTDGHVVLTALAAGRTVVEADRGGRWEFDVVAGETRSGELLLADGVQVRGCVVDEQADPVAGARVWLSAGQNNYTEGQHVATADGAGRFFLRAVEAGRFLSAHAPGLRAALLHRVAGSAGAVDEVELVLPPDGRSLVGRVVGPDAAPIAGARVLVGFTGQDLAWETLARMQPEFRPPHALVTDLHGEFRADGLAGGSKTGLWVRAAGFATSYQDLSLDAATDTRVVVRLQVGATVAGRVTDAEGRGLGGVLLSARAKAWFSPGGDYDSVAAPSWVWSYARADADGTYRLTGLTPGTLLLRALSADFAQSTTLAAADAETVAWSPVLADCAITGRVLDEHDRPMAGCGVQASPPRGKGSFAASDTDAAGAFRFARCSPVAYRIDVYPPRQGRDDPCLQPLATLRGVRPSPEAIVVRVPDAVVPSAAIEGALLDVDGKPASGAEVRCVLEGVEARLTVHPDPETGRFRVAPLPPGRYRVQGLVGQRRGHWSEPIALVPNEARDIGGLQMPVSGAVHVQVRGADGKPLPAGDAALVESFGWGETAWSAGEIVDGEVRIAGVAPGPARLRIQGADLPCVQHDVVVRPGEVTAVAIDVPAGTSCRLVLSPVTEPVPIQLTFAWSRDGLPWQHYVNRIEGHGELPWRQRMLPGAYEVTVTSETGKREVNNFVVGPPGATEQVIPIRLP